jgi:hypothetical protein
MRVTAAAAAVAAAQTASTHHRRRLIPLLRPSPVPPPYCQDLPHYRLAGGLLLRLQARRRVARARRYHAHHHLVQVAPPTEPNSAHPYPGRAQHVVTRRHHEHRHAAAAAAATVAWAVVHPQLQRGPRSPRSPHRHQRRRHPSHQLWLRLLSYLRW